MHAGTGAGAANLEFAKGVLLEHTEKAGCDTPFTTSNYGVTTTPRKEYEIVMGGREAGGGRACGGRAGLRWAVGAGCCGTSGGWGGGVGGRCCTRGPCFRSLPALWLCVGAHGSSVGGGGLRGSLVCCVC